MYSFFFNHSQPKILLHETTITNHLGYRFIFHFTPCLSLSLVHSYNKTPQKVVREPTCVIHSLGSQAGKINLSASGWNLYQPALKTNSTSLAMWSERKNLTWNHKDTQSHFCLSSVVSLLHFSINLFCKKSNQSTFRNLFKGFCWFKPWSAVHHVAEQQSVNLKGDLGVMLTSAPLVNKTHDTLRRLYAVLFLLTHLNHIRFPMTSVHFIVHQTTGEVRPLKHHRL